MTAPVRLTGDGVVLRPWTDDDVQAMVELFDDPDVAFRTSLPSPFTLDSARARLHRARTGPHLVLAVTTDGAKPCGEVLVTDAGTLGYVLGAQHRGRGLASRALVLLRDHAHAALGHRLLRLEIEADNAASRSVAARAGFALVAPLAVEVEDKGRRCRLDVWEHVDG